MHRSIVLAIGKKRMFPSPSLVAHDTLNNINNNINNNNNTPLFDACFVINLDRRPDRWRHVCNQIKRANLEKFLPKTQAIHNNLDSSSQAQGSNNNNNNNSSSHKYISPFPSIERISGIDGTKLDINKLYKDGYITKEAISRYNNITKEEKLFGMDLTPGALGCALSHRSVWEIIANRELDRALVLEDDVEFSPRFEKTIYSRLSRVPSDYDIVYFGGLDLLSAGKPPRKYIDDGVRLAYQGHRELTAYIIHSDAARRCLELSKPMTWQIDTHITSNVEDEDSVSSPLRKHNNSHISGQFDNNNNNNNNNESSYYISDPLSYVLQPSVAIQITSLGTDVQKKLADNPALEDASRRMREFVGGGTSVR